MRGIRFCLWISFVVLLFASAAVLLVTDPPRSWAQLGTPPSSTISSSSGPLAWDFGPVGGGTVINVGIQDICPPGLCDDHDLTVVLLSPAATSYQTMTSRPTAPMPPPAAPGAPTFINYPAPDDCTGTQQPPSCIQPSTGSTTAGEHGAGEPSIGVDWNTGKAFIEAGNHTLRVTFDDSVNPATAFLEDK